MKVLLDVDPGVDDAMMLLLALGNQSIDVLGITTVCGNVGILKATENALKITAAAGSQVAVYRGASRPLSGKCMHATGIHGQDGLGDSHLPKPMNKPERTKAAQAISEMAENQRLSIVATGPLTNIAMFLDSYPDMAKRIERIFLMGGVYCPKSTGNVTPFAEFNFYCDPEAADRVMASGIEIVAAGLDVTMDGRCAVDCSMLAKMRGIKTAKASTACKIISNPVSRQSIFHLHDVFALFAMLHPEIFESRTCRVRVETAGKQRGRSIASFGIGNIKVLSKVNAEMFQEKLLRGLS